MSAMWIQLRSSTSSFKPAFARGFVLTGLLLALTGPTLIQAQFNYTSSGGKITITKYTGAGGAVVVPSTIDGQPVVIIGPDSFKLQSAVTDVTIPPGVTSIQDSAFYACSNLKSVSIPGSVTSIEDFAFASCTSLTNIVIPGGITHIGDSVFRSCSILTTITIPNRVTSIGNNAFRHCSGLKVVYFEGNAPGLGDSAFFGDDIATVYYVPGTTGWTSMFGGLPTILFDPRIPIDAPGFGVQGNQFKFTVTSSSDLVVVIEAGDGLTNQAWSKLTTLTLVNGSANFSDPNWASHTGRFYRLRP